VLYALGAATAYRMGIPINWAAYWLGQVVVTSIQLMAQYLNEYYDMEVDCLASNNRTWFSGGSGVLAGGTVPPAAVLTAARICAVVALVVGVLASLHSIWIIPIIALCLLGSWFYSSPPISLMSSGWGELTTSIIVALLVPLAGYSMQGKFPPGELWLICVPLVLVHAAMLISFEIPDHDVDRSVGKKTLTVRLGLKGGAWAINGLIVSAYLFLCVFTLISKFSGRWMLFAAPLAIWQMVTVNRAIQAPNRTRYYLLTTSGIGQFVLMALLAIYGVILAG
jgi:1,4-dihydroxy-2-naphthoate octaprenyltransferase